MLDYLIVGAGLYGATIAQQLHNAGKRILVIEKRSHVGGNAYTESIEGINVHKYGAHIFHTNNSAVWNYVNQFANFNRFTKELSRNRKIIWSNDVVPLLIRPYELDIQCFFLFLRDLCSWFIVVWVYNTFNC